MCLTQGHVQLLRLFHFRIVVSAPYGEAVDSKLPRSVGTFGNSPSTGVIYTCKLTPSLCVGLTGDGNGDDRRLYDVDGWYFEACVCGSLASNFNLI